MTRPLQPVLTYVPLAAYLYLLAIWQAGRSPRVVRGGTDVGLLALGVGGLALFGPFGRTLATILFREPTTLHWALLTLFAVLVVRLLARSDASKLVIYHVDADELEMALRDVFEPGTYSRTLEGYEDRAHGRGVRVESSARWQTAALVAYGRDPEGFVREIEPRVRGRLRSSRSRASDVPLVFFGLSALTMLVPLTSLLLTQPRARAALRALLEHLHGS